MPGFHERPLSISSQARLLSRLSIFDVAWGALSPALACIARHGWVDHLDATLIYWSVAFTASLLTFQIFKISRPMSRFFSAPDAVEVAKACFTSVSIAGTFLFTFTRMEETPRSVPLIHFCLLVTGLMAGRSISRIRHRRRETRNLERMSNTIENIVIVGTSRLAWFYSKLIEEFSDGESRIIALLDERLSLQNRSLNGYLIVGSPLHASRIFDEYATHGVRINKMVIATLPDTLSSTAWNEILRISRQRRIALEILPERFRLAPSSRDISQLQYRDVRHDLLSSSDRWIWKLKRIMDIFFAGTALLVLSPLAILVALMVLTDMGYPVVFWQQRLGRFGRPLHVYKFRTMRALFDRKGRAIPELKRLSPIGQFIRATRLDEIPQLWNILTGQMSVVGPRPLLPIDQPKTCSTRLDVRPGLTGLAQISGGKLLSVEEKDAVDEHYVRRASVFLDLSILVRTVWVMVRGDRRNEVLIAATLAEKQKLEEARKPILHSLPIPPASGEKRATKPSLMPRVHI